MSTIEFVALVLASGAIIEVWHKGTIFAELRAKIQAYQDITDHTTLKGKLLELLTCPFCQSYHVPFYLCVFYFSLLYAGGFFAAAGKIFVFSLAATRAGNIMNGLLPKKMQYTVDPFDED